MASEARQVGKRSLVILAVLGCFDWSRAKVSIFIAGGRSFVSAPLPTRQGGRHHRRDKSSVPRNDAKRLATDSPPRHSSSGRSSGVSEASASASGAAAAAACVGAAALAAQQRAARQRAALLRQEAEALERKLAADREAAMRSEFHKFQALNGAPLDARREVISAQQLTAHAEDVWGIEISREQAENLVSKYGEDKDGLLSFEEFCIVHKDLDVCLSQFETAKHEAELAIERANMTSARKQLEKQRVADEQIDWMATLPAPLKWNPTAVFTGLCLAPYFLPVIDTFRFFTPLEFQGGSDDAPVLALSIMAQPLLLLGVALLAISEALPRALSFNLSQALILDMILLVVRALLVVLPTVMLSMASSVGLRGLQLFFAMPVFRILSCLTFVVSLSCIMYSLASTLCGEVPDRIPYVSESARERADARGEPDSEEDLWIYPAPKWSPGLGLAGFSIAAVEFAIFLSPFSHHHQ